MIPLSLIVLAFVIFLVWRQQRVIAEVRRYNLTNQALLEAVQSSGNKIVIHSPTPGK